MQGIVTLTYTDLILFFYISTYLSIYIYLSIHPSIYIYIYIYILSICIHSIPHVHSPALVLMTSNSQGCVE